MLLEIPLNYSEGVLYRQLAEHLEKMIRTGSISSGERLPGTRELVRDGQTGWLIQSGSVEQISEAVKRAFSQREAYACIQAQAYAWAQNFTIERAAQQYLALYQQITTG